MANRRSFWQRIGPAFIVGACIIGPGSVTLMSTTGANYGYRMIWVSLLSGTLMAGFLAINYALLAATIVINLRVDQLDRAGREAEGDALDLRCRWVFPLLYFVGSPVLLVAIMAAL